MLIYFYIFQHFILIFIGQASAIGLTIKIPVLIKTLAESSLIHNTGYFSFDMGPVLKVVLDTRDEIHSHSESHFEETFVYNWWDIKEVNILFLRFDLAFNNGFF